MCSESIDLRLTRLETKVDAINERLHKQAGFIGGAMFIITGLMSAVMFAFQFFLKR